MTETRASSAPGTQDVPIKPAATVIVMRSAPELEVLMVQRSNSGMFANALVFPGGMLEEDDEAADWLPRLKGHAELTAFERSLRISAIREVWEETGILLCDPDGACPAAQPSNEPGAFRQIVEQFDLTLDLSAVQPFSNWITPPGAPKRYDTHFFLAQFHGKAEGASDGVETTHLKWLCPNGLLERHDREEIDLLLPTLGNLQLLTRSESPASAIREAGERPLPSLIPVVREIDGVDHVTVPPGTPFEDVALTTARMTKPRKTFS